MNKIRVNRCGIILLAAGQSSRMGNPKQLLEYKGRTLLLHSVDSAIATGLTPVIVVLGANRQLVEKELVSKEGLMIIFNSDWEEGMASSIRCGIKEALEMEPELDGIIIMVCDQPFVGPKLLKKLLDTQRETGLPVVGSHYNSSPGVPALFHKSFFEALLGLRGDTGARKLLKECKNAVAMVDFPEGNIDIDTKEDYDGLISNEDKKYDSRFL